MSNPFRASIFAKKVFTHHGTKHYLVLQCNKYRFKMLIFYGTEIPENYFSSNQLLAE